jgi:hypothetical protein
MYIINKGMLINRIRLNQKKFEYFFIVEYNKNEMGVLL